MSASRTYESVTEEAMGRVVRRLALMVAVLILVLPAAADAQATITGVVRDASGAVLPGVTVEAASPALIEKVRSVVTDGDRPVPDREPAAGDLHGDVYPGGLRAVKRDGLELTGTFVATVNADLKVSAWRKRLRLPARRRPWTSRARGSSSR